MERLQETAKENFVKEYFAKNGIASVFLYKAICDLPGRLVRGFAIRQLALWVNSHTLFPIDLSIHGVNHQSKDVVVDELDIQKKLQSSDLQRFFADKIRIASTLENLDINDIGNLDFMDIGHGRVEYIDWAWDQFQQLSYAKRGGLIIYLKSLAGKSFFTEAELIANGVPNLKNTGRRWLKMGSTNTYNLELINLRGWGYKTRDENISALKQNLEWQKIY